MRKLLCSFVFFSLFFVFGVSHAANHGRFLCTNCDMPMNQDTLNIFVRTVVNLHVNIWQPNDSFAVCNGSVCMTYVSAGGTQVGRVFNYSTPFPDPKTGYKSEGKQVESLIIDNVYVYDTSVWWWIMESEAFYWSMTPNGYVEVGVLYCTGDLSIDQYIGACP